MSKENVEVVRAIYAAWDRGESASELVAEDIEYVNPPNAVEAGTKHGRRLLASVLDVYPDFRIEAQRYEDLGDDVLVIGTARGTGASGLETRWQQGYIWTVKDGVAVRFRWFNDPAEALAAAGLDG